MTINKKHGYRYGVKWIAISEDSGIDAEIISSWFTVQLLASLFGKESNTVAKDVVQYRIKNGLEN